MRIIGGRRWEPEDRSVERLLIGLLGEAQGLAHRGGTAMLSAATLGGCRLQRIGDGFRVWREARGLPPPLPVAVPARFLWDGRYVVDVAVGAEDLPALSLEALGVARAQAIAAACPAASADVPKAVWPTLPCLADAAGLLCVPHLGYRRSEVPGTVRVTTHLQQNLSGRGSFLV